MRKTSLPHDMQRLSDVDKIELLLKLGAHDKFASDYMAALLPSFIEKGVSREVTEELIIATGEAVEYLSRLMLYAKGDERSSGVVDIVWSDSISIAVCADLPPFFNSLLAIRTDDALGAFTIEHVDAESKRVTVSANIESAQYPDADFSSKDDMRKLACSAVFCGLFQLIAHSDYVINRSSLLPQHRGNYFFAVVADEILNENIKACGNCGKPVYVGKRVNSKPFCNRGHQNRYNEKAKRMLKNGAAVDDVIAAFPCVGEKTIRGWCNPWQS